MENNEESIITKFNIIIWLIWILGFISILFLACSAVLTTGFPIWLIIVLSIIAIFLLWLSTTFIEGFAQVIQLLSDIKNQNKKED